MAHKSLASGLLIAAMSAFSMFAMPASAAPGAGVPAPKIGVIDLDNTPGSDTWGTVVYTVGVPTSPKGS